MNINTKIEQAEKKWLDTLYTYCQHIFCNAKIPSHDHTHHLRVWHFAKEIIKAIGNSYEVDFEFVEACLIASLFHDTGLSVTLRESHGKESKNICIQYFTENKFTKPAYWNEILFTIENHDDKNYKQKNYKPDSLFSVICNADDLDAFGNIGVIRYTEIYLLRGISLNELPQLVIQNLDKRFLNFENTYKKFASFYDKNKEQYLVTRRFFNNLQEEII